MILTTLHPAMLALIGGVPAIGLALWMRMPGKRALKLRLKVGAEYDGANSAHRDGALVDLHRRERTPVAKLNIRPLKDEELLMYSEAWHREQALFVDDPRAAVFHVDTLVQDVMQRCGYPVCALDQVAIDLSEDHPWVVEQYRTARELARRKGRGERGIEDLRKAMVAYLAVFEDLLHPALENDSLTLKRLHPVDRLFSI